VPTRRNERKGLDHLREGERVLGTPRRASTLVGEAVGTPFRVSGQSLVICQCPCGEDCSCSTVFEKDAVESWGGASSIFLFKVVLREVE